MADLSPEVQEAIDQGVELCRSDEWKAGLDVFAQINLEEEDKSALPAEYYSYLGYCVARFERRLAEGVKLCEHAAAMNQNSAEVLYNLARVHLLLRNRRRAVKALTLGLKLHPTNPRLQELRQDIGVRRQPVLRFLHRDNRLNQSLGRLRSRFEEPDLMDFDDSGLD